MTTSENRSSVSPTQEFTFVETMTQALVPWPCACNEAAADLARRRPAQFGFWASLPLPDVEGSLAELSYALDTLGADGVCVLTNHHSVYLSDVRFEPVWRELHRRGAKVFVHPTVPDTADEGMKGWEFYGSWEEMLSPVLEFFFDEARMMVRMLVQGTVRKFAGIQFVVTHAGGVMPALVERAIGAAEMFGIGREEMGDRNAVRQVLRERFHYDLAGWVFPDQIHALLGLTHTGRILYGSDYPYMNEEAIWKLTEQLDKELLSVAGEVEAVRKVNHGNAQVSLERRGKEA